MRRYCPNCGTEVDETALFCPTCGSPIDEEVETQLPPAPAWPEPDERPAAATPRSSDAPPRAVEPPERMEPVLGSPPASRPDERQSRGLTPLEARDAGPAADAGRADERQPPEDERAEEGWIEEPTRAEPRAALRPTPPPVQPVGGRGGPQDRRTVDLPFTMPVMLSGWLIGAGALLATIGVVIGLFTQSLIAVDLILALALLGVAATVFLSASMPEIPHLRLAILAVLLVGFGMALDRLLIRTAGVDVLLLFLGTAAAVIGALLVELGRDAPVGSPRA